MNSNHPKASNILVVGGGVVGMTAALHLAESDTTGRCIELIAEKIATESLSRVAAASFYPFAVDHPHVERWLEFGRAKYLELAKDAGTGIVLREGMEIAGRRIHAKNPEGFLLPSLQRGDGADDNAHFVLPIIELPIYLPYLRSRLEARGVRITRRRLESIDEIGADSIVVNCSGSEARRLTPDPTVKPTLGQLVRTSCPLVDRFMLDEREPSRPTYVVPRSNDVVLGSFDLPYDVDVHGYEPPGADDERTADILKRATALDPRVADAKVLEAYCGFRPRRPKVRVEIDSERLHRGRRVIHDYGHGGGGVTLSWGCAQEVLELAQSLDRM